MSNRIKKNETKKKIKSKNNLTIRKVRKIDNSQQLNKKITDEDNKNITNADKEEARNQIMRIESKIINLGKDFENYRSKTRDILVSVLKDLAFKSMQIDQRRVVSDNQQIGTITPMRNGHLIEEKFIYGDKEIKIKNKKLELNKKIKFFGEMRKKLQQKRKNTNKSDSNCTDSKIDNNNIGQFSQTEEILKISIAKARKELCLLDNDLENIKNQANEHILFSRLIRDEKNSIFNHLPILKDRYLLFRLTGKGGFSEVWKAFDLDEYCYVAIKIHQLDLRWSDQRKSNYIKHATREYQIHRNLSHPTIVPLHDVFGIDLNSFCTVMQFCNGSDLEKTLKKEKTIPEKESKLIALQIFQGLKYLSEKTRVIHYDLKPANILFHNGIVQITDFGLSKILQNNEKNLELTSQGAGTYWYLPPEAFDSEIEGPPVISSKVDVWSAGVITYQMLFGIRPFAHNVSQESIIQKKCCTGQI